MSDAPRLTLELGEDWPMLRDPVRRICDRFPGEYWQKLDAAKEYPHAFVDALTEHEYLAALIPEEYGGAGLPLRAASVILETIHASGCNARRLSRADVHDGNAPASRQRAAEARVPAEDRVGRAATAGVRRHRADHRVRHHAAQDARRARRRQLRDQRPEDLDQPRAAIRPDAAAGAHHAGRPGGEALGRTLDLPGRSQGAGSARASTSARSTP